MNGLSDLPVPQRRKGRIVGEAKPLSQRVRLLRELHVVGKDLAGLTHEEIRDLVGRSLATLSAEELSSLIDDIPRWIEQDVSLGIAGALGAYQDLLASARCYEEVLSATWLCQDLWALGSPVAKVMERRAREAAYRDLYREEEG